MEPWLALIHREEVQEVLLGSRLVFSYVKWEIKIMRHPPCGGRHKCVRSWHEAWHTAGPRNISFAYFYH